MAQPGGGQEACLDAAVDALTHHVEALHRRLATAEAEPAASPWRARAGPIEGDWLRVSGGGGGVDGDYTRCGGCGVNGAPCWLGGRDRAVSMYRLGDGRWTIHRGQIDPAAPPVGALAAAAPAAHPADVASWTQRAPDGAGWRACAVRVVSAVAAAPPLSAVPMGGREFRPAMLASPQWAQYVRQQL